MRLVHQLSALWGRKTTWIMVMGRHGWSFMCRCTQQILHDWQLLPPTLDLFGPLSLKERVCSNQARTWAHVSHDKIRGKSVAIQCLFPIGQQQILDVTAWRRNEKIRYERIFHLFGDLLQNDFCHLSIHVREIIGRAVDQLWLSTR